MHSGFANLRSALPMNLKARLPGPQGLGAARSPTSTASSTIWRECLATYGGPFLFGKRAAWPTRCTRRWSRASSPTTSSSTAVHRLLRSTIMAMPEMMEWIAAAKLEPDDIDELDMEF